MRRSAHQKRAAEPSLATQSHPSLFTLTLAELCVSPLNVRTNQEDAEATDALEQSILRNGLLNALLVHPLPTGAEAPWGALAGGRRLRAIRRLVDSGQLRADWPIPVRVLADRQDSEITELSLSENLLRRDLRPYEIHAAICTAHEQGATVEEIAARCGQRVVWVRQQLRLGTLAPEIFAAYADGQLSLDQAQAYAATEDQELQCHAFEHFAQRPDWDRTPARIRTWLRIGDRQAMPLLRFVGEPAFVDAGGRLERDLFDDGPDQGIRVVDEDLLRRMAEDKLAAERDNLRARANRPDLRFIAEPPQLAGYADRALEIQPAEVERSIVLPEGEVVATLKVEDDGSAHVRWWWASRKAKRDAERQPASSSAEGAPAFPQLHAGADFVDRTNPLAVQTARAAVREEHGLSADGLQVMRSLRRELLRALLVDDAATGGTLGRDYVIWAQLRQELGDDRSSKIGARGLAPQYQTSEDLAPGELIEQHLDGTQAHAIWTAMVESVECQPFIRLEDSAEAFAAYAGADDRMKSFAGAVLAGIAMLRSANVPGWRIPVHDRLATMAGGHDAMLRELWKPSADFMAMFPKMQRLELAQPFVDPAVFRNWSKLDNSQLSAAAAALFSAPMQSPAAQRSDVASWVHPLLSFGVASDVEEPADG